MEKYIHKVNYYETDKMGITHHSNHIRWMEEARIDFFEKIGLDYGELERRGVFSPVLAVECEYKAPTTFGDKVAIEICVEEYSGVKLTLKYTMTNEDSGELVLTGRTKHCFVDGAGKLLIPKRSFPDIDAKLRELI
ncbi:MAG: acyl-CoA thioesterase [Clostridia bacterium]|nr:acyl-CoA thioesterase [Clostridia bacterium]